MRVYRGCTISQVRRQGCFRMGLCAIESKSDSHSDCCARMVSSRLCADSGNPGGCSMRLIFIAMMLIAFVYSTGYARSGTHSLGRHSSRTSKSFKPSKNVHVHGYTRKNGTVVRPYDRGASGTATPYRRNRVAAGYTLHSSVQRD